jgi:hypothetical protein
MRKIAAILKVLKELLRIEIGIVQTDLNHYSKTYYKGKIFECHKMLNNLKRKFSTAIITVKAI